MAKTYDKFEYVQLVLGGLEVQIIDGGIYINLITNLPEFLYTIRYIDNQGVLRTEKVYREEIQGRVKNDSQD